MISQVIGALVRALLVLVLVAMPAVLLPDVRVETAQVVLLFGLFGAVLTFVEYTARYPGLIEFRHAPPYNRIRFAALAVMLLLMTMILRGTVAPSTFTLFVQAVGALIGQAMDFPFSPVRLVLLMLPTDTPPEQLHLVRAIAGIGVLVSLLMLAVFMIAVPLTGWPMRNRSFNVWVNLPTFDPTAGGDVVARMERAAFINVALGILLPFLVPAGLKAASLVLQPITLAGPQTLIWVMAAWAFFPAALLMRGIAMGRLARMVRERRRRNHADGSAADLQPV